MRVLHVVSAGELGGAERMLVDLVRRHPDDRDTHTIALFSPSERVRATFRGEGLHVLERPVRSEGPLAMLVRSLGTSDVTWLEQAILETRADVVHLHTFGSQVVGTRAALAQKRPIVRTEHSTRVFDDPSCWAFVRFCLPRATISCAVSESVRETARKTSRSAVENMRVLPNGVRLDAFSELAGRPPAGRARAAVVGRLEARKGIDVVLRAVARIPELELDVCGDGPDAPALRELARSLGLAGRTRFLGHTSDVHDALRNVDLVVSGARKEGLGLALLEAMAARRLVVATPVGGVPEFVDDGQTGFLSTDETPEALARAIGRALRLTLEAREVILSRARALVVQTYSVDAMRAAYAKVYREARDRHGNPGSAVTPEKD